MKKYVVVLTALGLLLCMVLAGCSSAESKVESEVEDAVSNVESKVEDVAADVRAEVAAFVEAAKGEADKLLQDLLMEEKATVEVIHHDERVVRYEFTILEEDAETELAAIETKMGAMEDAFMGKLAELREKGVEEAQIIVSFLDKEGTEIYSKVFS